MARAPSLPQGISEMGKKHLPLKAAGGRSLICVVLRLKSKIVVQFRVLKKGKLKKKFKDSRVDLKEVYISQVVDRYRCIESLLTNNYLSDSKDSARTGL